MDTFNYTALSPDGKRVSGVIEAYNEMDAAARVKQNYPIVVQLSPVGDKGVLGSFLGSDIGGKKLNDRAFTLMCGQFATILRSGIPVSRTVTLIAEKMDDKPLKNLLTDVGKDVEAGRSLSASFAERGKGLLPQTFVETVRAGEESGRLEESFESASEHYTKQMRLKGKVRGALIYPTFVIILAIVVVAVLMVKVVPTFIEIFRDQDQEVPAITRSLIFISDFFRNNWYILLVLALGGFIIFKLYTSTEKGKMKFAKFQLKMPVLGEINVLNAASQFTNTLAMMIGAGLPITKAVSITGRSMSNYYISSEIHQVAADVEVGTSLGKSLKDHACLPDILNDMAAVGEESGELESTLAMTAEYYDNELEQATQRALAKLEPATLIFIGIVAGYIVIAIYIAMFSMYNGM